MSALVGDIGKGILDALQRENEVPSLLATRASPAATGTEHTSLQRQPPPPPPILPAPQPLSLAIDVTTRDREADAAETKEKFSDIWKVNNNCDRIPVDISSYDENVNVKGRLHLPQSIKFFETIGASKFILDTLKAGHFPKLKSEIVPYEIENHGSFFKHYEFGMKTLSALLEKGRIEIVDKKPRLINPLHVVEQRLKNRLILDCSILNKYIEVPKIKYDNHEVGFQYFKKGVYMFSYDLRDGYHHLMIHPEFRDFLGFKLIWNGKLTYFRYVVGCFGLADLPYIFTKIYRPLVAHWRGLGIPAIKFLDDGGFFVKDEASAIKYSDHVKKDLIRSGSIYSEKKCIWKPTQEMTWLGFVWNSKNGTVAAAPHRVDKIKASCAMLLSFDSCPVRQLAGFVGMVISLSPVVGNCSRLATKQSQIVIASSHDWDASVQLSCDVKREFIFWRDNIDKLNCRSCIDKQPPILLNVIEGDASSTGCGSILNNHLLAARIFSEGEREAHSTFRELANIHFSIYAFLPNIKNSDVKFRVDNQASARIIEVGSMKPDLQWFATEIFFLCFNNNISLKVEWIPRDLNKDADWASREADYIDIEDWGLTDTFFTFLNNCYGPFSLDAFANFYNKKCDRFYSLFHTPGSLGVDALSFSWEGENVLLVPPVNAIGKALFHLRKCRAKGVLIAPKWPSSFFWPILLNDFPSHILEIRCFKGYKVLQQGLNQNSLLGSHFSGDIISVWLDCSN